MNKRLYYLREFVCILPLSLPCLRGKVRPVRPPATGVFPASIFNPLGVSRDSMRAPIRRSSLEHFFGKTLPVRGIRYTISFFEHLSSESVKNDHKKKKCEKVVGFCSVSRTLFKNTRNRREVLQKSSPCNFYRVLYCFRTRQNVLISLGGAHIFPRRR